MPHAYNDFPPHVQVGNEKRAGIAWCVPRSFPDGNSHSAAEHVGAGARGCVMSITAYVYRSRTGLFSIELHADGRWHVMWNEQDLGSCHNAKTALSDLVGGLTQWPACGDPALLGISDQLSDWEAFTRRVQ